MLGSQDILFFVVDIQKTATMHLAPGGSPKARKVVHCGTRAGETTVQRATHSVRSRKSPYQEVLRVPFY